MWCKPPACLLSCYLDSVLSTCSMYKITLDWMRRVCVNWLTLHNLLQSPRKPLLGWTSFRTIFWHLRDFTHVPGVIHDSHCVATFAGVRDFLLLEVNHVHPLLKIDRHVREISTFCNTKWPRSFVLCYWCMCTIPYVAKHRAQVGSKWATLEGVELQAQIRKPSAPLSLILQRNHHTVRPWLRVLIHLPHVYLYRVLNLNGVMAVKSDVILINRSWKLTHPGECVAVTRQFNLWKCFALSSTGVMNATRIDGSYTTYDHIWYPQVCM